MKKTFLAAMLLVALFAVHAEAADNKQAVEAMERGLSFAQKGDMDAAIGEFDNALKLDPKVESGYFLRGYAYFLKQDYDRAITDLTKAIEIDPNYDNAYANRGEAYKLQGDFSRARQDLEAALRINPNHPWAEEVLEQVRGR